MTVIASEAELAGDGGAANAEAGANAKRQGPSWARVWEARPATVFILSLASGLIVSSILIVLSVHTSRSAWGSVFSHPGHAFSESGSTLSQAYGALLTGSIASPGAFGRAFSHSSAITWSTAFTPLSNTIVSTVPLLLCGLGLSIAYRSGVFSIGAQAQLIGGAVLASWVGFSWAGLPTPIHVAAGLVAGILGGALLGALPAVLKVLTGASEVISTIMLNYVMANLLVYLVSNTFFSKQKNTSPVGRVTLPSGSLPALFGSRLPVNIGLILAAAALVFVWAFMSKSRVGFELELSGASPGASTTGGVNRTRTFITAFVVSGAIVGLGGAIEILGTERQLSSSFGANIGVLAIAVAFVGRNRPIGIMFAAILYGVLETGGLKMQGATSISYQLTNIIESVIVLFMVAPALVAELYHLRATRGGLRTLNMSRGWGK
jgi:general nucleoside transport system permease protein